jgi:hypothetical protein
MTETTTQELTEEQIGERLHHAVDSRVNSVLGSVPVPAPSLAMHSAGRVRSKVLAISICVLTVLGVGARQGIEMAQNEKEEELVVASDTTAARGSVPRMVLRSSEYVIANYQRLVKDLTYRDSARLTSRAKKIPEAYLYLSADVVVSRNPAAKPLQIGKVAGTLERYNGSWMISWPLGELRVSASGRGSPSDALVDLLASVRVGNDQKFVRESLPNGFSVTPGTQPTDGYNIFYNEAKSSKFLNGLLLGVNVFDADGPLLALPVEQVNRNGRAYSLMQEPSVAGTTQTYVWWPEGTHIVSISVQGSTEEVLALADQVQPATAAAWKAVLRSSPYETEKPVRLRTGEVDDELGTRFTLEADVVGAPGECRTIALRWIDHEVEACVNDDSKELVRVLRVTNVEGLPVVFGVLSNASPENQVVRVTDAEGDVVGEEVAYDALSIKGRAFAFPLDKRAVAPFTVEIFDFDRVWYTENFEKLDDAQTFVSDEAEPILQLPVSLETTPPLTVGPS